MTPNPAVKTEDVEALIREVGRYQLSRFRNRDVNILNKTSALDLVTEVDVESERRLTAWIRSRYPDHDIMTEEQASLDRGMDWVWVIDPLDGTTNFASGLPIFAISVALMHRGSRFMGWVHVPYTGDLYRAEHGQGAWFNGEKMPLLTDGTLDTSLVATGFPYDRRTNPDNNLAETVRVIPAIRGFRRMGAAAYDLCLVAQGVLGGFWERGLKPWDVEAALLMVEEVGGTVIQDQTRYGNPRVIAGKPMVVETLKNILDQAVEA